ncbi:precorrin-2 C20-methyltransferase/precorrin-3B C17-methyltransferase [Rhodococcus sp. SMB37]|uniref:precorrin-2 C(20)-methyltransferase n=1 Tax=Rhodococcus sp. SMB37 TaxID=2512213 RepID=UPI001046B5C3|nr:precorrin-2 C(20)-methyltransferase [Rhodococcus sp. SMB37]TCN46294.1 precorrin-2 C20-methyltransferase/precorrin-3B C17-methyltransferase [Rhodococcus sp. SMB37]
MTGRIYGVGLGPGDPELITRKAARLIAEADVIAYHSGTHGRSIARGIAAGLIPEGVTEEKLVYPVTVGTTDHPGGYDGAIADFYDECAARLAAHLDADRTVVVLCEGDPLFYGSYMYLHDRLSEEYVAEVIPGVTSFSAAAAAAAEPLVRRTDVLTILPGTLPEPELARRLADTDGAVIMKLGRTFESVRSALEQSGRLDGAVYVERATMDGQRIVAAADVDPDTVPYFSVILAAGDKAPRNRGVTDRSRPVTLEAETSVETHELLVIGLGPADDRWLTPEASAALASVDHVVGYGPYVDRVPVRPGLQRHSSGNTVEVDRARFALDLTLSGEKVAVVSGGDAGVFGMASAVFEAAQDDMYASVPIRVLPGVSAVQAVAARAGAPIGGDFAVMSLSDRLKPWSVIEKRLTAIAEADLVLAIYNPASRSRATQVADARSLFLQHRPGDTVVVIGRDVGRTGESLEVTTLEKLDPTSIDMKCLLIIGAAGTSTLPSGSVWTSRSVGA